MGAFFIPAPLFTSDIHILLCPYQKCCFSCSSHSSLKKHLEVNSSHSHFEKDDKFLVLSKKHIIDGNVTMGASDCWKCRKKFVDKRSADRHTRECAGKGNSQLIYFMHSSLKTCVYRIYHL